MGTFPWQKTVHVIRVGYGAGLRSFRKTAFPGRVTYRWRWWAMITVMTRAKLKQGSEPDWDQTMRERLEAARNHVGWVGGQLLMPLDALDERVIVGTWQTRADWEAWHTDAAFLETRRRLEGLQEQPDDTTWHEVVAEVRQQSLS
jgi:heme-degrading monooxygenase HmoA